MNTQLRLRLAATFVAFTALLLTATGYFFQRYLTADVDLNGRTAVEADWEATAGFLHVDNQRPLWVYDRRDPDEAYTVERLRHVYQLTSPDGNVLEQSAIFESIMATRQTPRQQFYTPYSIVRDQNGTPYAMRVGWIRDDQNRRYGLAIGRSLAIPYRRADGFVQIYGLLSLPILALVSILSWWLTGVAMRQRPQET
jgi:hypothetical protein